MMVNLIRTSVTQTDLTGCASISVESKSGSPIKLTLQISALNQGQRAGDHTHRQEQAERPDVTRTHVLAGWRAMHTVFITTKRVNDSTINMSRKFVRDERP